MGATVVNVRTELSTVVELADSYAEQIARSLPAITDERELRQCLAGSLLAFLADALVLASQHE